MIKLSKSQRETQRLARTVVDLSAERAAFLELWAAAADAIKDTRLVTHERYERLRRAVKALPNGELP